MHREMARRVAWAERAAIDLDKAAEYIARDSPVYAASLVRQAHRAAHFVPHHGDSVSALVLQVVGERPTTALEKSTAVSSGSDLIWRNTREGWQDCADLAKALVACHPGHQYLPTEGVDDATAELSFGE